MISRQYTYGSHSYNLVAAVSGDYVLSIKTGTGTRAGAGFNYAIKSSHSLMQGPTPTINPIPPTPLAPITLNAFQGDEAKFSIQNNLPLGTYGPYIVDFGDGNPETTSDQSVSHNYQTPGNYTIMVTIPQNSDEKIIQTYLVTATPKESIDLKVIVAIIGATSLYIAIKTYRRRNQENAAPAIQEKETKTNTISKRINFQR
jgi:hypothetical protein